MLISLDKHLSAQLQEDGVGLDYNGLLKIYRRSRKRPGCAERKLAQYVANGHIEGSWRWNEEVGNYCEIERVEGTSRGEFKAPLREMKLSGFKGQLFSDALQAIYGKRNGAADFLIGSDRDYDVALAKEMGVYE